jgi:hypothetical protein
MNHPRVLAMLAAVVLAAGCGSSAGSAPHRAPAATVASSPLDTSLSTSGGTWATVVMGGSAAQYNNFWQLFTRPAGSSQWKLATPPGTADNGGLVLAAGSRSAMVTGFRPSQLLTFTPLSQTSDGGRAWSAISPLDAALASTPAAIALQPGGDRLIALTASGRVEEVTAGSGSWQTLTTASALAATAAGRRCGLRALTGTAWTHSGVPLLAGNCSRPGVAGIFALDSGTWRAAGPALPASLGSQAVTVLRIVDIGSQTAAVLSVGEGPSASLVAAWTDDAGARWTVSPGLGLAAAPPASASFGPGGQIAVISAAGRAATIAIGQSWRTLPALPARTATLAFVRAGHVDALSVRAATLTVWQLGPSGTTWTKTQVITVPIQYDSSS